MTELSFAKSFLTALDAKPTKLSADYVEDPRNLPARSAQILPKMSRPLAKRQKLAPGQERSINVSLKSLRNPPIDITLSSQLPNTSILDLKTAVSEQASIPVDKLRILHKKKPVGDSKVLKDVVSEEENAVEFSIMVMGGAASVIKSDGDTSIDTTAPVAQGRSGKEVLSTEEFWSDLQGFLTQRLRDENQATEASSIFRRAWDSHGSAP